MSKYCVVSQVRSFLKGNDAFGEALALEYTDAVIAAAISAAESEIDTYTGKQFQLRRAIENHGGRGKTTLMMKNYPIFTINNITIRYSGIVSSIVIEDGDGSLLFSRKIGKVALSPAIPTLAAVPGTVFERGDCNISIDAFVGWGVVGDNFNIQTLGGLGFYDYMIGETEGDYKYFNLPNPIPTLGDDGEQSFADLPSLQMFKGSAVGEMTDDSENWEVVNPTQVRCATEDFESGKMYRLAYVPASINSDAVILAACRLLQQKAGRDDSYGSGGASSRNVSGFSESYAGGYMYADLIKQLRAQAMADLDSWKSAGMA